MARLKSFTLIELLIVIVIIGILATALIPRIKGMQDRARYMRVEKDFQDFRAAVYQAQTLSNMTLFEITESGFTAGTCINPNELIPTRDGVDFRSRPQDSPCRMDYKVALAKIEIAANMPIGSLSYLSKDPRGSPYILDENEGESNYGDYCQKDYLISVGADGFISGMDYNNIENNPGGDNRGIYISPIFCPGAY